MKNKKNLLVTLARFEQAKQLFSSVYWNAGWKGDYMLLTPENELSKKQLGWFKKKGILIKKCPLLPASKKSKTGKWPPIVFSKLYLFTPEFKKWKTIIFIEADTTVRASLDNLTKIKGFATIGIGGWKLSEIFLKPLHIKLEKIDKRIYNRLKKNYDLNEPVFNAGVLAFNTSIIKKDTFSKLKKLLAKYIEVSSAMEESILNLYFHKKWKNLPVVYNLPLFHFINFKGIKPEKIKGIILHFHENKPWNPKNPFYKEWKSNLEKAELIDLKKIPPAKEKWSKEDIENYCKYLRKRHIFYYHKHIIRKVSLFIDTYLGLLGIFLKNNFPKLYFKLKSLREKAK